MDEEAVIGATTRDAPSPQPSPTRGEGATEQPSLARGEGAEAQPSASGDGETPSKEAWASEVAALRAELAAAREQQTSDLADLRAQLADAQQGRVEAHRRALIAEHVGQIVDELVTGASIEELDASVEQARAVYARAVESARRELGATVVPIGASPRAEPNPETMSPIAKIAAALNHR